MKELWSRRIRAAVPYVPGEQPKDRVFIKLNTNENPYPPSPKVLSALREGMDNALRLYPDPECSELRQAIAAFHGLSPEQVFPGNGSDEILAFSFQAFFDPDRPVLFPDITYSFYEVYVKYFGLTAELVPLREDFSLPVEAFCGGDHGGVVVANPNAPTGKAVGLEELRRILAANRGCVVLVDEAYVDFGGESATALLAEYDNLLVVRTLSKSRSLAGLRVGYALGAPDLIAGLCCVRDSINSYTVDRLAQLGGAAAMEDRDWFETTRKAIIRTRETAAERLRALGFAVLDSKANFLFITHPTIPAKTLLEGLRERGILVRYFNRPRIDNYLRVSIGTDAEMDALCGALEALVK